MRVLMFGWEFPPHISGGLGTACHGLANALTDLKVDVLFVVPRLSGDEVEPSVTLISASDIVMRPSRTASMSTTNNIMVKREDSVALSLVDETKIKNSRTISPYDAREGVIEWSVQHWSYQLNSSINISTAVSQEVVLGDQEGGSRYNFKGGYGPGLMEEVRRYAEVAKAIATTYDYDVIHAHDWISFPAGIAAKEQSGKPLVVHVHATEFDRSGESVNQEVFQIEQRGMQAADRVLAVSQWTRQVIINRYGIAAHKVDVVYNGIVPKNNVQTTSGPAIGSHVVTFLGRITHQKGPYYFAEAARRVLEKFPDARFVVAGSGDMLPSMIEFVARKKISSRFHFTGFLKGDALDKVWAVSDVYVMPSVSEPFGLTPLEAIQSGVPVIISKQSGVSEVMHHAIKIDFWNTESLASAICSVLKYKSLSHSLTKNSSSVIEKINWKDAAKKIKHLYYELTQHPGRQEDDHSVFPNSSAAPAA